MPQMQEADFVKNIVKEEVPRVEEVQLGRR